MDGGDGRGGVFLFLGPPGVGKGTQASIFSKARGLPHIATGDILRDAARRGTPPGREAKEQYMDRGNLVPDKIMLKIVNERIDRDDCDAGIVFDGFPRTRSQANYLDGALPNRGLRLERVLYLDAPEDVVVERLSKRRVCPSCRANYHLRHFPPRKEGVCDRCGTDLIWRDDDHPETVRERLKVYENETAELVQLYEERSLLFRVDASGGVEEIRAAIEAAG
ncbi:MAG: adenylate kinase [Planctomycetota bacterium]|nr:adenylate kinase [Planctomycetota bacterium]